MIIKTVFIILLLFAFIPLSSSANFSSVDYISLNYTFTVSSNVIDIIYQIKVYYNPINKSGILSRQLVIRELTTYVYYRGISKYDFIRKVLGTIMDKWIEIPLVKSIVDIDIYSKRYLSINKYIIEAAAVYSKDLIIYRDLAQGLLIAGEAVYPIEIYINNRKVDLGNFIVRFQLNDIEPSEYIRKLSIINYPSKQYMYVLLIPAILLIALSIGTLSKWRYYMII